LQQKRGCFALKIHEFSTFSTVFSTVDVKNPKIKRKKVFFWKKNFVEKSGKNCTALLNREESLP